jgi:hypothetical protein
MNAQPTPKQKLEAVLELMKLAGISAEDFPEEWTDDQEITDPIPGHLVTEPNPHNSTADSLLQLIAQVKVLSILLLDGEEAEFNAIRSRLELFKKEVAELPTEPRPRRRIGFTPPTKPAAPKRKGARK